MGNCKYCGQSAGLFKSVHKECQEKHAKSANKIISFISEAYLRKTDLKSIEDNITQIAASCFMNDHDKTDLIIKGWTDLLETALEDGVISEEEETRLLQIANHFSLDQTNLDQDGSYTRFIKALVLRDLYNGILPNRMNVTGQVPFNLMKSERIIWLFNPVDYIEQKIKREYVGGSAGVSIRIARGVYYRIGAFKGHPIEKSHAVHVDTGILGITNKHIYFYGHNKKFRIKYEKIVSFYSNCRSDPVQCLFGDCWQWKSGGRNTYDFSFIPWNCC